jgi:hypothetical protein
MYVLLSLNRGRLILSVINKKCQHNKCTEDKIFW